MTGTLGDAALGDLKGDVVECGEGFGVSQHAAVKQREDVLAVGLQFVGAARDAGVGQAVAAFGEAVERGDGGARGFGGQFGAVGPAVEQDGAEADQALVGRLKDGLIAALQLALALVGERDGGAAAGVA